MRCRPSHVIRFAIRAEVLHQKVRSRDERWRPLLAHDRLGGST